MRKNLKYIFILGLCIISGIAIGLLLSNSNLISSFVSTRVSPFKLIVLFLAALFLSTAIHEIAHAMYFILNHIKLRYVSIFIFCLRKTNKHYKFTINIKNIALFGGIVIPEIPIINSSKEFKLVQNIYSEALILAPLISLFESFVLTIIMFLYNKTIFIKSPELFWFIIFNVFIGITIFFSSFIKTENVYGDFPAFKNYRFDDKFAAVQLMQYMFFNTTWEKDVLASKWLIKHIVNQCRSISSDKITLLDIDMLDLLLNLHRMNFVVIDNRLTELLAELFKTDLLFSLPSYENRNSLFYHLLYFFYSTKKIDKVYLIDKYEMKKEKICFANKHVEEYYKNLTEHIIFQKNKSEWLINNISPNSTYSFLKIFESVNKLEVRLINQSDLDENL